MQKTEEGATLRFGGLKLHEIVILGDFVACIKVNTYLCLIMFWNLRYFFSGRVNQTQSLLNNFAICFM